MGTPRSAMCRPEIAGGHDAVPEIVGIEHLFEAGGDRVEVAPGEAAVGRESPRSGSAGWSPAGATRSSFEQRKPPILAKASFFAENVQPSANENIFCAICLGVQAP